MLIVRFSIFIVLYITLTSDLNKFVTYFFIFYCVSYYFKYINQNKFNYLKITNLLFELLQLNKLSSLSKKAMPNS